MRKLFGTAPQYVLLVFCLFFLMQQTHAEEPFLIRPLNNYIDIAVPCSYNGGSCPNTTTCNMTLLFPNTTKLLTRKQMSKRGDNFNLTLSNVSVSGDYRATTVCCYGRTCDTDSFLIRVSGEISQLRCPQTVNETLVYGMIFALLFILIGIGFYVQIGAMGILGSLGLIVMSWLIINCQVLIGAILLGAGLLLLILFAMQKWY